MLTGPGVGEAELLAFDDALDMRSVDFMVGAPPFIRIARDQQQSEIHAIFQD
jgi:hypothetical protein